jgi:hypothetical protein
MRNPNRTTKGERRFVRQYNPYAARVLGVAQAARWYRDGILLDEAQGFDNLVNDLMYGPVPLDLNELVTAALGRQRDALERKMGTVPGAATPTSSNVNHWNGTCECCAPMKVVEVTPNYTEATGYDVEPEGWVNLRYPTHVSTGIDVHHFEPGEWQAMVDATRRAPASVTIPESLGGGTFEIDHAEAEPLGPSECGYYEVVQETMSVDALAVPYLSEPRPQVVPESWALIAGAEGGQWFAKYQAYREGREAGEEYLKWNGDPWHDPNEVAAVHAEAIEDALNDDIDPEE